ncbi:MAG: NAD(P)-dependent oxidoreductase [Eubacteriales bacterium]
MDIIVGYTGFVGSNICIKHNFDRLFNSMNIEDSFGINPELCVYSGVRAEKFLANSEPEKDFDIILNAIENIKRINPKKIVLISTADIYIYPVGVDENSLIETEGLQPYGKNRYYLEEWIMNNIKDYHIIRLPGLFGENIKKNFIYDLINVLPSMLNSDKYNELSQKEETIKKLYVRCDNGFYKCVCDNENDRLLLKQAFEKTGFSALNFTDSRAIFQFYNLSYLWEHINTAIYRKIKLLNVAVEPICVDEVYFAVKCKHFVNEMAQMVPKYDLKTIYSDAFGGANGYIFDRQKVLQDVKNFITSQLC